MSTINRNIKLDDLIETNLIENNNLAEDDTLANLIEINNLIEISESNISTNLIETDNLFETSKSNISTNLMETDNLIESSESNTLTNLIEISNLITTNESTTFTNLTDTNNLINLIELIEAQKNELIKSNLIEINQQFTNIKVNIIQKYSFSQQIELLTTVLLKYQKDNTKYILDPEQFQQMIETNEPKLKGFFNEMIDALIPRKRLEQIKKKQKNKYKKDIAKAHPIKLNEYFNLNSNIFYCFNIDDFHDIHRIRRPNTTTLTSVNHIATCVAKPIIDTSAALAIVNNNCSFFNPDNFSKVLIIKYLYSEINGAFDISYNSQKFNWINNQIQFEDQNQV
ncbi:hypothetical protein F8M41_014599 [Gigaspora margarita]|uniref:Uncharacterized protein n=1 Tax=Gigaspora margarita TaxID=4874 RepID=A0A8H4B5W6_GIGMA|nr:hypothetical protein F8M41_014599 [Gigaspora margarita]